MSHPEDVPPDVNGGEPPLDDSPDEFQTITDIDTRMVTITFFKDETAASLQRTDLTLPQLAGRIAKQAAASKMELPWLKLAIFGNKRSEKNCLRTNANLVKITGIEIEHDAGEVSFDTAIAVMREARIRSLLYTSPSYVPATKERWRILVPLSQNHPPETRETLVARINGLFRGDIAPESFVPSQAYLFGHVNNPDHRVEVVDGDFLDLRDNLYAGSIFKDGSKIGEREANDSSNGGGQQRSHRSRKDDDTAPVDRDKIEAALNVISSNCTYEVWLKVAAGLHYALGEAGFELFDRWSAKATGNAADGTPLYTPEKSRERWHGARTMTEISTGTIFYFAGQADPGWHERYQDEERQRASNGMHKATASSVNGTSIGAAAEAEHGRKTKQPLQWLDMSKWDSEPVPQRQWAIRDRVPLNQVGLFSGEGGTGKSIIELMKDVAHVHGADWLGSLPEIGPAFYLAAEDDTDELHIRLAVIAQHYHVTFEQLTTQGLRILPLLGKDAVLCAPTKSGHIEVTDLYRQLYDAAGDLKPINISIDTLSRAFAGNEIDRVQVYAFAMHMQALAKVAGGSVTVLSHPSLSGMASGSGISGSTAWHGAFRFRQYLKGVKSGEGEQPDNDLRELEFKKNQYGPLGESIPLRYQNGLFLPVAGVTGLDKLAREAKAESAFLDLLRRFDGQGQNVSHKKTSPNYAPTMFAAQPEAKVHKFRRIEFETAMLRLFAADKIHVENYGRPSRPYSKLAVKS